jgi:hypothetical protein
LCIFYFPYFISRFSSQFVTENIKYRSSSLIVKYFVIILHREKTNILIKFDLFSPRMKKNGFFLRVFRALKGKIFERFWLYSYDKLIHLKRHYCIGFNFKELRILKRNFNINLISSKKRVCKLTKKVNTSYLSLWMS